MSHTTTAASSAGRSLDWLLNCFAKETATQSGQTPPTSSEDVSPFGGRALPYSRMLRNTFVHLDSTSPLADINPRNALRSLQLFSERLDTTVQRPLNQNESDEGMMDRTSNEDLHMLPIQSPIETTLTRSLTGLTTTGPHSTFTGNSDIIPSKQSSIVQTSLEDSPNPHTPNVPIGKGDERTPSTSMTPYPDLMTPSPCMNELDFLLGMASGMDVPKFFAAEEGIATDLRSPKNVSEFNKVDSIFSRIDNENDSGGRNGQSQCCPVRSNLTDSINDNVLQTGDIDSTKSETVVNRTICSSRGSGQVADLMILHTWLAMKYSPQLSGSLNNLFTPSRLATLTNVFASPAAQGLKQPSEDKRQGVSTTPDGETVITNNDESTIPRHPVSCKPCAFYWSKGCLNGLACHFCHDWHAPKKKKPMKDQKNLMIIARDDGRIAFLRCPIEEALRVK